MSNSITNSLNFGGNISGIPYKTCMIKSRLNIKSGFSEAEIYKTREKDSYEKYSMQKDGRTLGEIELETNKDSVFIINLEAYARHRYKGIGTNLLAIAVEKSLNENKNGIVTLNAQPLHKLQKNPEKFYEKMGFVRIPCSRFDIITCGQPMKLTAGNNSLWMNKYKEDAKK